MKVIKKINNNVALCVDGKGRELVAFGKGIGFKQIPYDIEDLSLIDRTYYSVKKEILLLLQEIDEEVFEATSVIFEKIRRTLKGNINDSLYFVLVDHFSFAITRAKQNLYFQIKIKNDILSLYEEEVELGLWAVRYLNKKFKIKLLDDEAAIIALHITENTENPKINRRIEEESIVIQEITNIVENFMNIKIDKKGFNYSRFVSHIQYLMKRHQQKSFIYSDNRNLFSQFKNQFPDVYACTLEIKKYANGKFDVELNDEELLYLMLHINRMISREDCNQ